MKRYLLVPILENGEELMGNFEFNKNEEKELTRDTIKNYNKRLLQMINLKIIIGFRVVSKEGKFNWMDEKIYYKVNYYQNGFDIEKCEYKILKDCIEHSLNNCRYMA